MEYHFADCVLDDARHALKRAGETVQVEPLVFDLIYLLVRHGGELVTRDQIIDEIWKGRIISDSAVTACVAAARKAVGDDGKKQAIIRTVARRGLQLAAPLANETAEAKVKAPPAPKVRYAAADDGAMLAYTISGKGPPVATVSFFMTDIEKENHTPGLHEDYDAIRQQNTLLRFDQRGAGLSRTELDRVDFEVFAEDMRAVLDAAGLERTAVFAKTAGALTALTFAALYPERVNRLVLMGGYVDGRLRRNGDMDRMADPIRAMIAEGWEDPRGVFMPAYMTAYFPDGPDEIARAFAAYSQGNTSLKNILAFRDAVNLVSIADCLPRINCPVLVIHGRHDKIHPISEAQKIAAGVKDSELLLLESANHIPLPGQRGWETYLSAVLEALRD